MRQFQFLKSKRIALSLLIIIMFTAVSCTPAATSVEVDAAEIDTVNSPMAVITLDTGEVIKVSLLPDIAPNTVNNFISLSEEGFYDGLIFHRVIEGFMIQGGDPLGTGMGGPGYTIKGEFNDNGFSNGLKHSRGVISMARSRDMDSAGSQFFIMHQDSETLDGKYASFGIVAEGIEIVDRIALVKVDRNDKPLEPITIKNIAIELNGYEPAQLKTIE